MTPALHCRQLCAGYPGHPVLDGLDLNVAPEEVVAVLGLSGSGKSTLLSVIAGFLDPAGGEVAVGGEVVADARRSVPPEARDVAVVFQHGALWPHMTAAETVAYPFRRQGVDAGAASRQARDLLSRLGLEKLAERRPAELSGGEQQRVGLARALARRAGLYLFDEPTAHVDAPLREALLDEIAVRRADTGAAALYATHDAGEALAIANRVALLRDGRFRQVGTPADVYEQPTDVWGARLTGPASLLTANGRPLPHGRVSVEIADHTVTVAGGLAPGCENGRGDLLVRPDWVGLGGPLPGLVDRVSYRGPHTDYRLRTPVGQVDIRERGVPRARPGERSGWDLRRAWFVPPADA